MISASSGEPDNRRNRTEGLLLEDPHPVLHAGEHGGIEEQSLAPLAADHRTARPCRSHRRRGRPPCRAPAGRPADRPASDRSSGRRRAGCARASAMRSANGRLNPVVHVDAIGAHARLSGIAELRRHHLLHGRRNVGVLEDDERRVAAKLERHALHRARGLRVQLDADLGAAGEGRACGRGRRRKTPPTPQRDPTSSAPGTRRPVRRPCTHNSPRRIAVSGDCSAGFNTTVHPAASAGATLRVTIAAGKFHGVTA